MKNRKQSLTPRQTYRLADGPVLGRLTAWFAAVIGMPLKSETNHAGHQQGVDPVARFTHGKALAVRPDRSVLPSSQGHIP